MNVEMKWTKSPEPKPETLAERLTRYLSLSDRRPWFTRCRCGWNKHPRMSPRQHAIQDDLEKELHMSKMCQSLSDAADAFAMAKVYEDLKGQK